MRVMILNVKRSLNIKQRLLFLLPICFFAQTAVTLADVQLPEALGDHMVLQQDSDVTLWGWASAGESVQIETSWGVQVQVRADVKGQWQVKIKTPHATSLDKGLHPENIIFTVPGEGSVQIRDVLIGEVWLCSGQSNMMMMLRPGYPAGWCGWYGEAFWPQESKYADRPYMRCFNLAIMPAMTPQSDCKSALPSHGLQPRDSKGLIPELKRGWQLCTTNTAPDFSAVAYYFGAALSEKLNVPVGLVTSTVGGTGIKSWISGAIQPEQNSRDAEHVLFNGMIAPLSLMKIKGVIWYQGETDAWHGEQHYDQLLQSMITDWRKQFNSDELPFYFVQMPRYSGNAAFREAQATALKFKNTGMVVISDLGVDTVHHKNKRDIGRRLAWQALNKTYGRKDVDADGPIFQNAFLKDGAIHLAFINGGLASSNGTSLKGFEAAGEDGKFLRVSAIVVGDEVVVSTPPGMVVRAVRMGWNGIDIPNLMGKNGLPAWQFQAQINMIQAQIKGRVRAADFGLVPNTGKDTGPAFTRLLAAAAPGTEILLEKGRYDVWCENATPRPWQQSNSDTISMRYYGIMMEHLRDVTLDGAGSDFVFHGRQTGIGLAFCTNMTLKNFTMDWQRPEISQGLVMESGTNFVVVKMHADTPAMVENGRLLFPGEGWTNSCGATMEWDPKTGGPAYQRRDLGYPGAAAQVAPGVFRLETREHYKVGNVVIFRHGPRSHATVLIHGCTNTVVENVDAYSSCGLGLLAQHSDTVRFTGFHFIPKPRSGRLFSSRDDGLQVSCCKGLIEVDRCTFEGMLDDPINVHGFYLQVTSRVDDRTLRCRLAANAGQDWWAAPGDRVAYVLRDSIVSCGSNSVASFKLINNQEAEVRLKLPIPADMGPDYVLENSDVFPSVVIRNSRFGNQRARGILFTTPRSVLIENNTFYTSGCAILANGDANFWCESGAVHDAIIRSNTFINCNQAWYQFCEAVISIDPVVKKPQAGRYSHSNVRVENNVFKTFDAPVLYAESVDGLTFSGNIIERTHDFAPWHTRKAAVTLERCRNVTVRGTKLVGDVLGPFVKAPGTEGLKVEVGDALKVDK